MSSESATESIFCKLKKNKALSYFSDSSGPSAPSALSDFKDPSPSDPRAPSAHYLPSALNNSSEFSDPSVPRYCSGLIDSSAPHDPSAPSGPRVHAITGSWHSRLPSDLRLLAF